MNKITGMQPEILHVFHTVINSSALSRLGFHLNQDSRCVSAELGLCSIIQLSFEKIVTNRITVIYLCNKSPIH